MSINAGFCACVCVYASVCAVCFLVSVCEPVNRRERGVVKMCRNVKSRWLYEPFHAFNLSEWRGTLDYKAA